MRNQSSFLSLKKNGNVGGGIQRELRRFNKRITEWKSGKVLNLLESFLKRHDLPIRVLIVSSYKVLTRS